MKHQNSKVSLRAQRGNLNTNEIQRYERQLILKSWSTEKQLHLKALHVAVAEALPSAAIYLAAAGVGRISIVGNAKKEAHPTQHISAFNPHVAVETTRSWPEDCDCCIPATKSNSPEKHLADGALAAASVIASLFLR